jgi:hypothetical protein
MALDDFLETEVAIAAGLTAAAFSPRVRQVVRRGAVLGLAGMMSAGDAIAGAARGAVDQAQAARGHDDGQAPERPTPPVRRAPKRAAAETG